MVIGDDDDGWVNRPESGDEEAHGTRPSSEHSPGGRGDATAAAKETRLAAETGADCATKEKNSRGSSPLSCAEEKTAVAESSLGYESGTGDTTAATSTSPGADPRPSPPTVDVSKEAAGTGPYSDGLAARPSVPTAPAPPNPTSTSLLAVTTEAQGSGEERGKGGLEEVGGSSNQGGSGVCSRSPSATLAETTTVTTPTTQAYPHGPLSRPSPALSPPGCEGSAELLQLSGLCPHRPLRAHLLATTACRHDLGRVRNFNGWRRGDRHDPPEGINNGVVRNGGVETSWGAISSQATNHIYIYRERERERDWAPSRGSPGSGSVSHHQRGNDFGANSAPAAREPVP